MCGYILQYMNMRICEWCISIVIFYDTKMIQRYVKVQEYIKFSQWNFIALFSLNLMQMNINHTFKCRYFMWRLSCNNFIFHVCTRSNIWTIPKIMHGMRECMICYHFMWYFHHFMWGEIKQKLSKTLLFHFKWN